MRSRLAGRLVQAGHGAVVIDPKGDQLLAGELERAARKARRAMRQWTPEGPGVYDPFAYGADTELADKVLAVAPAGVVRLCSAAAGPPASEAFLGAGSPAGEGTRTRTREFVVHPDTIKRLPTGTAAVTSPGEGEPRIARMHHPRDAR